MKRKRILLTLALLGIVGLAVGQGAVSVAAPHNGYEIALYTIDGGGGMSSIGGTYSLGGTIGQADTGALNGGTYTLQGGFWGEFVSSLFLPIILR